MAGAERMMGREVGDSVRGRGARGTRWTAHVSGPEQRDDWPPRAFMSLWLPRECVSA